MDVNKDTEQKILTLLSFALGLLAVTLIIGIGLMYLLRNPELLAQPPKQEIATVEAPAPSPMAEEIVDGIHVNSGFRAEGDYEIVIAMCTSCHSSKLVLQNRADREGWKAMIKWMQETQNLPDLGENEAKILDYLAEHYAPEKTGRRANLAVEDWYEIQ